ncbi:siderophore-interacting protein [Corynebacterium pelargi]|nr:siderophore-interacting protein [Corynebacterium pelargi]
MSKLSGALSEATYLPMVGLMRMGYRRFMAIPDAPLRMHTFEATVVGVKSIAPQLRRVVLRAPQFADFQPSAPDEYVALILPQPGRDLVLPEEDVKNIRSAVGQLPEEQRPDLRWYTIRAYDNAAQTVTIDLVVHGAEGDHDENEMGPGARWALQATEGQTIGIHTMTSNYQYTDGTQLLVADAASHPALLNILESLTDEHLARTHVVVVGSTDEQFEPTPLQISSDSRSSTFDGHPLASYHRLTLPQDQQAAMCLDALDRIASQHGTPKLTYAWVCAEASIVKAVRRHLVSEWDVAKNLILFSGYWRVGKARG